MVRFSTGGYGHINTFNTPGFETRTNKNMNLKNYYETLKKYPESLSQLNHPGKTFGNFSDYAHYDVAIDEVVTLIEVGNGEGAIRSSGYFPSYEEYTRKLLIRDGDASRQITKITIKVNGVMLILQEQ